MEMDEDLGEDVMRICDANFFFFAALAEETENGRFAEAAVAEGHFLPGCAPILVKRP